MRAPATRWAASGIGAGSAALMVGALALAYADRHLLPASLTGWDFSDVSGDVVDLALPVVGLVLTSKRPANRIGWAFLVAGFLGGLWNFSTSYAHHALFAAPGSWPAGRAFGWLSNWVWVLAIFALAFAFLLFPDGQLRSRGWRTAAWLVATAFTAASVDMLVNASLVWPRPFTMFDHPSRLDLTAAVGLMIVASVLSVAAVVVRFARSAGEERLQLKWFAAAAVLLVGTLIPSLATNSAAANAANNLAELLLWVAIGVAVLKYRLYDIDLVISKAVQYGSLAAFITAVYAGLVVGVGTLAGNQRSPLLAALAAAVVAVAFQPVRQRAGRLANRVVYGRRASPYQVLSDFARRIGSTVSSQDVLPEMAQIVAAGTGADQVVVWLRVGDDLRAEASSDGSLPGSSLPVHGQALPSVPGADLSVPVVHQDVLLGAISIKMPRDEPLRPGGQQLVADVAS